MREQLLKVLRMLSEGKLNIEKSADLIEAMYEKEEKDLQEINSYNKRMLRVLVDSTNGDNVKVNLPIAVITSILKATGKLPIASMLKATGKSPIESEDLEEFDFEMLTNSIIAALDNEMLGEIVTIESGNNDVIKVLIE